LIASHTNLSHHLYFFFLVRLPPARTPTPFPYTTLFRSCSASIHHGVQTRRAASVVSVTLPKSLSDARRALRSSAPSARRSSAARSEEHTSELQSPYDLVCRLLLEKKK